MFKPVKGEGGFTLIELMIVVNIIGILSAMAINSSFVYLRRAREKVAKENLRVFRDAITLYSVDTEHFPEKVTTGDYYSAGNRGGGNAIPPDVYKYLRKIPNNHILGEDDDYPSNWVTQFESATYAEYEAAFSRNWDGWFYYYKINGEETGALVLPRSDLDVEGTPYRNW